MADVIAQRSLCVRDQVGAIIVSPTQRIVAEGYNGPPAGFQHEGLTCDRWCNRSAWKGATGILQTDYSDCPALHAEANALMVCDRKDREGGTIYTTSHVCMPCAKLIANSGLAAVYVHATQQHDHRNPLASYEFLRACGLEVFIAAGQPEPASR